MRINILMLVIAVFFIGCTSIQEKPIDVNTLVSLKGKTISITKREQPVFLSYTPKIWNSGLVGFYAAKSLGSQFVKDNNMIDPAFEINKKLAVALQDKYGIINTNNFVEVSQEKIEEIAAKSRNVNLVLDFQTLVWTIDHADEKGLFHSKDYVVTFNGGSYSSKAVLIDVESKSILAETNCLIRLTKETDEKIPFEKVTANNAELLKAMFAKASDDCMNKVKADLFGIKQ